MSNLVCIAICILISLVTSACFMSVYKEEIKDELKIMNSRLDRAWSAINALKDNVYIDNAKICDLKNKLIEMEKLDDGK